MNALSPEDRRWLDAAVREATPFLGTTGDRPTVGAIVTDSQSRKLLGRAVTSPVGLVSAATHAIDEAGDGATGATLYSTLGLDDGIGQPILDAILASGLTRVVMGVATPAASTGETDRLAQADVEVLVADHAPSRRLHEGFISRETRRRPFVSARLAVSADGKVGAAGKGGLPIVGEEAWRWTQAQRAQSSAIMIGWGTARLDDPTLTIDLKGLEDRQPLRVVVAGLKAVEERLSLLAGNGGPVLVVATPEKKLNIADSVEVLRVKGFRSRPELLPVMTALAARGVQGLFIEAGPTLLETLFAKGLVDRFHLLQSEVVAGPKGMPATPKGSIESRIALAGFSLVDHRLLGADNLRTFERIF